MTQTFLPICALHNVEGLLETLFTSMVFYHMTSRDHVNKTCLMPGYCCHTKCCKCSRINCKNQPCLQSIMECGFHWSRRFLGFNQPSVCYGLCRTIHFFCCQVKCYRCFSNNCKNQPCLQRLMKCGLLRQCFLGLISHQFVPGLCETIEFIWTTKKNTKYCQGEITRINYICRWLWVVVFT